MAEYIEKQAAMDAIHNHYEVRNPEQNALMDEVSMLIFRLPAADVRPVRRGRWVDENIYKQTMSGKTYDGFTYCSNCKHDFSFGYRSKFCPDCGSYNCADMMGGDAE